MKSPLRWLKRKSEISRQSPRRKELEKEISAEWKCSIRLVPAATKGGYDEIYYALDGPKRIAVVRVNSPFRRTSDPIGEFDPGIPLGAAGRLDREWDAYSQLAPENLSPKPMWRTEDAIACSWLDWHRASRHLVSHRNQFWTVIERILPAIRIMHDLNVTHLDLNLGNILLAPETNDVAIIDFEFGPVDWVSHEQQMAFDYLRFIADCTKRRRGGQYLLGQLDRLVQILKQHVPDSAQQADMKFCLHRLHRLIEHPQLLSALRKVFSRL